jgi:hypothetical protein
MTINQREKAFVTEDEQNTYIEHPAVFCLSDGTKYTPDFYCIETDEFIEVSGTRQAHAQNKGKYERFRADYPNLKFRIVNTGAWKENNVKNHDQSQKAIAYRLGISQVTVSEVKRGNKHTTNKDLALMLSAATGKPGIDFISPRAREAYILAYPELQSIQEPTP